MQPADICHISTSVALGLVGLFEASTTNWLPAVWTIAISLLWIVVQSAMIFLESSAWQPAFPCALGWHISGPGGGDNHLV
jgi:hypothetical protein